MSPKRINDISSKYVGKIPENKGAMTFLLLINFSFIIVVKNNLKNQINLSGLQKDRKFEKSETVSSKEGQLKTAQVLSYFIFAFFCYRP